MTFYHQVHNYEMQRMLRNYSFLEGDGWPSKQYSTEYIVDYVHKETIKTVVKL